MGCIVKLDGHSCFLLETRDGNRVPGTEGDPPDLGLYEASF